MSYFNADDIRKIGLSPFQALGSLSGIRRGSTQTRQMRAAKYSRNSVPIVLNKAETGLTIEKHQPIRDSFVTLGASTAAFVALIQSRVLNAGKVIQHNVVDSFHAVRQKPAILLSFVPLLVGGIVTYTFLSMIEPNSSTASDSSNQTLVGNNTNGIINGVNGPKLGKQSSSTAANGASSSSNTTDGSTPMMTTPTTPATPTAEPGRGSVSTNLPAGGTTNYVPSGIPAVTQPVTTTIPGTNTTIDNKPAIITDPASITLN
ncbi:hypothetical protein H7Y29_02535 [Microbacteriaceae bacterium]|nr:hypothetical protein [Candidatus Saccharibacteria bacterium]